MRRFGAILLMLTWSAQAQEPGGSVRWSYKLPFPVRSLAVSERGVALVGSDFGNYLHAVDVVPGTFLWKRDLAGSIWSPAVVTQETAYLVPNAAALIALRIETGEALFWLGPRFPSGDRPPWQNKAPPAVGPNRLWLVSLNGTLCKLDLTGKPLSQVELQGAHQTDQFWSRPALAGDSVFVGSIRGRLYRLASETLRCKETIELDEDIRADLIARDDRLYVSTVNGSLYAFRADPERTVRLWKLSLGSRARTGGTGRSPVVPLVLEDRVLVASRSAAYCLDRRTGGILWKKEVESGIAAPLTLVKDRVQLVTGQGELVSLALSSGQMLGGMSLRGIPTAGPLPWGQVVLLGFSDGVLQAVSPP